MTVIRKVSGCQKRKRDWKERKRGRIVKISFEVKTPYIIFQLAASSSEVYNGNTNMAGRH